jgi:hypothetical protein
MNGFQAFGFLLALPLLALVDWFTWINRQPRGQQELTKACHGVGMLALLAFWFWVTGGLPDFVRKLSVQPDDLTNWIPAMIAAWGLGWFQLNAGFAAQAVIRPHRSTTIVRGLIKLALGYAVWTYAHEADIASRPHEASIWSGLFLLILHLVAVWCLATGATKVLLMMWGGRRGRAHAMVTDDIAAKEFDWDQPERRGKSSSVTGLVIAAAILGLLMLLFRELPT